MTHFMGGVMGSNADFNEIGLKPKEWHIRVIHDEPKMAMIIF